jgi:hypothetical protein
MRLAELGAVMLEPIWHGAAKPHHVRCKAGHDCYPCPNDVKKGVGICKACSYTWNIFYIVAMPDHSQVKFGITSNDPKPRLWAHARDGYNVVIRLYTDLPNSYALEIEQRIMAYLGNINLIASRGREYFDGTALPAILSIADALVCNGKPDARRSARLYGGVMYEIGIDTRYAMLISGIGGLAQLYAIKQSREGLTPMKLAYLALWAIGFASSAYVTVQIMRE